MKLEELLNYVQPTEYIVTTENYSDRFETPVLTAGKTFVLGKTNEREGIYPASKQEPVILFDDFTTASQWVDFPFKVKSSACKILTPKKDVNLKYVYYAMKSIRFNASQHMRYWISKYSKKEIRYPDSHKQALIVESLDKITNEIKNENRLLSTLDSLIKSRFNEMFKNITTIKTIGEFCTLKSGMTFPKEYELSSGDILYCKVSDMNLEGNEKYLITSKTYVEKSVVKKALIPKGSICFPKRGAAIGTNKKRLVIKDTCVDLNVMAVTPNELVRPEYLFYVFLNIDLLSLCDGSIIPQLNNTDINPIKVKIPSIDLQDKFIAIVHHIDKLKFINKK